MTVLQESTVLLVLVDSQVTRGHLEILVQLDPEGTRDKMGSQVHLGRKEPWELPESDLEDQTGLKVQQATLGTLVLLVPVVLLVLLDLRDSRVVLVLLDLLVLLDILVLRESAMKETKERPDPPGLRDQMVPVAFRVLLVLQVLVLKETKGLRERQVILERLVAPATAANRASRGAMDEQAHLDSKACWETLASQDLLV